MNDSESEGQKRKRCDSTSEPSATAGSEDGGYVAKKRPTQAHDIKDIFPTKPDETAPVDRPLSSNSDQGEIIETDESPASPEDGQGGLSDEGEIDDADDDDVVAVNGEEADQIVVLDNTNTTGDEIIPTAVEEAVPNVDIPAATTPPNDQPLFCITYRDAATVDRLNSIVQHALRRALFQERVSVQMQLTSAEDDDLKKPQLIVTEAPASNGNDTMLDADGITLIGGNDIFMIDAEPTVALPENAAKSSAADIAGDVPQYRVNVSAVFDPSTLHTGAEDAASNANVCRRPKNNCFNCDGDHTMRDCPEPRNAQKIRENRMQFNGGAAGGPTGSRYHIDANQKFGHFVPGQLGDALRQALGLRHGDLPMHVYRMRMLGYPPGWLEAAQVTRSGLTLFGDAGAEGADGVVAENGTDASADAPEQIAYDLKKIHEYPGFNVPLEEGTFDISYNLRLPPMCESQSKAVMLQRLRNQSTKSYKRLKVIPNMARAVSPDTSRSAAMDMEMDETEEAANPPVPGFELEMPPPPPPSSPPLQDSIAVDGDSPASPTTTASTTAQEPIKAIAEVHRSSPTLDDLKQQQEQLLAALDNSSQSVTTDKTEATADDSLIDDIMALNETQTTASNDDSLLNATQSSADVLASSSPVVVASADTSSNETASTSTPLNSSKHSLSGTPLIQSASQFTELPAGSNWSVGVSDIIDFENLADSTGKFQRMKSLIKKVRVTVKQLNDEYDD